MVKLLLAKLKESSFSVIPIIMLVLLLTYTIAPMPSWSLVLFLVSAFFMILGIAFFNLGVDMSLIPIGEQIGSSLVKSRKLPLIVFLTFIIGIFISVAEPDLIVLAGQINGVPDSLIIIVVALGVGIALVGAFLRILFQVPLSYILISCYLLAFILSGFTNSEFLSIAWESGGVTTGPIMVPFIMALGLGLASIRADKTSEEDSFGLISLCLIGPILAVLILGMFFTPSGGSALNIPAIQSIQDIVHLYGFNFPVYFKQIAIALFPMLLLFGIFQIFKLHLKTKTILKISTGTIYTYLGLVLFLTSANVGFMPAGYQLGNILIENNSSWLLILIGMVMGYFVVAAEPSVFVLKRQVEDVTEGVISAKSMGLGLSIGVAISVGLAMLRVVTGLSILYFVIPGYLFALSLTFVVPRLFTAIAFDSGAVASGPLAATFMLPFAIGASETIGGNIYSDAFGIVALVAMTPVITIQLFGLVYAIKSKKASKEVIPVVEDTIIELDYSSDEIDINSDNTSSENKSSTQEKNVDLDYRVGYNIKQEIPINEEMEG
ncbi:MAG: DUF1538 domain-containing protein [Clostridiaceae bacterium]|jgi:hypothetical protein|nr:DUF1538 domain-containing protein [Clostridiaceae bacterium]